MIDIASDHIRGKKEIKERRNLVTVFFCFLFFIVSIIVFVCRERVRRGRVGGKGDKVDTVLTGWTGLKIFLSENVPGHGTSRVRGLDLEGQVMRWGQEGSRGERHKECERNRDTKREV